MLESVDGGEYNETLNAKNGRVVREIAAKYDNHPRNLKISNKNRQYLNTQWRYRNANGCVGKLLKIRIRSRLRAMNYVGWKTREMVMADSEELLLAQY